MANYGFDVVFLDDSSCSSVVYRGRPTDGYTESNEAHSNRRQM